MAWREERERFDPFGLELPFAPAASISGDAAQVFEQEAFERSDERPARPLLSPRRVAGEAVESAFEHDSSEIQRLIAAGDLKGAVRAAIAGGERDDGKLANLLLFALHPDRDPAKPLKPKENKDDAKLAQEWRKLRAEHVLPVIEGIAEDPVLKVRGRQIAGRLAALSGDRGQRFKALIETAAQRAEVNPGLLAAAIIAETGGPSSYLLKSKVSSYHVGVDDFYAMRHILEKAVPAYKDIKWDRNQKPTEHLNDAQTKPRMVKTILFDSGADGLLATAVYLKYAEVRLCEDAIKLNGDFYALPVETRFALIRMSMGAGRAGAQTRLVLALKGKDILKRDWSPPKIYQTNRNATIRAAEAMFLSGWIFGIPLSAKPVAQIVPETWETKAEELDRLVYEHATEAAEAWLAQEGEGEWLDRAVEDFENDETVSLDSTGTGENQDEFLAQFDGGEGEWEELEPEAVWAGGAGLGFETFQGFNGTDAALDWAGEERDQAEEHHNFANPIPVGLDESLWEDEQPYRFDFSGHEQSDNELFEEGPPAPRARGELPAQVEAEGETEKILFSNTRVLALLPHKIDNAAGTVVDLNPAEMNPRFYDGADKYKIAPAALQTCLENLLKQPKYRAIKAVALVDLTKDLSKPNFAGVRHTSQLFVASVSKVAAMLAAFQLRKDLRATVDHLKPKDKDALFSDMRDQWIAAQADGKPGSFTRSIALRGRRVIVGGRTVPLAPPVMPRLDAIFEIAGSGGAMTVEFKSTGETLAARQALVDGYNKASNSVGWAKKQRDNAQKALTAAGAADAATLDKLRKDLTKAEQALKRAQAAFAATVAKLKALGFRERLGISIGGDVPVSNFTTFTVVGDVGYGFLASVMLQTGLYDPARGGGLWLGARYGGAAWRGAPAGGPAQSGTAASLVAFMALMAQERLVDSAASKEMQDMMVKVPALKEPGTGSWLNNGLAKAGLPVTRLLAKVGLAGGAADEIGFVCRDLSVAAAGAPPRSVQLRYAVAILRSTTGSAIEDLVVDIDKCILANNALTPTQGGHRP